MQDSHPGRCASTVFYYGTQLWRSFGVMIIELPVVKDGIYA